MADLKVEPKPVPSVEILSSGVRSAEYNDALEKRGDGLADQVSRLCVWAKTSLGMKNAPC